MCCFSSIAGSILLDADLSGLPAGDASLNEGRAQGSEHALQFQDADTLSSRAPPRDLLFFNITRKMNALNYLIGRVIERTPVHGHGDDQIDHRFTY